MFLNSGQCKLPDDRRLVAQFLSLERRTSRGGKDSIDHAPSASDDLANAVAGVPVDLPKGRQPNEPIVYDTGRDLERDPRPMKSRLPETHTGVLIQEHAARGCLLCISRAAQVTAQH